MVSHPHRHPSIALRPLRVVFLISVHLKEDHRNAIHNRYSHWIVGHRLDHRPPSSHHLRGPCGDRKIPRAHCCSWSHRSTSSCTSPLTYHPLPYYPIWGLAILSLSCIIPCVWIGGKSTALTSLVQRYERASMTRTRTIEFSALQRAHLNSVRLCCSVISTLGSTSFLFMPTRGLT